jgi:hypothetical protein
MIPRDFHYASVERSALAAHLPRLAGGGSLLWEMCEQPPASLNYTHGE